MSADAEFARVAREYLDDRAERHPDIATGLGDHRFDARLADPSAQARDDERRALDGWAARLAAVDHGALSAEHRVDAAMMADSVARRVFEIDDGTDRLVGLAVPAAHLDALHLFRGRQDRFKTARSIRPGVSEEGPLLGDHGPG